MTEQEAINDIKRQILEIDSEDADITISTKSLVMAIKALEEIQQYRALGTVEELRVARDKQVGKKPPFIKRSFTQFYVCPGCSNAEHYEKLYSKMPYCFKCGQKLDWSDEDDKKL